MIIKLKETVLNIENGYNVNLPITLNFAKDLSLHNGHFQFRSSDKQAIAPFSECTITDDNGKVTYWYANSTPKSINLKNNRWIHDVFLIEPTKRLERIILGARTFSRGSSYFKSIKDLINLIIETCIPTIIGGINPLKFYGSKSRIVFDDEGKEVFNKDAKEYFFPEGTTLMEALIEIGHSIHAYPRLKDFNTLYYDFYDATISADISLLDKFEESSTYSLDQYCNSVRSVANNAIDESSVCYYPFGNRVNASSLRSESVRISSDTALFMTDKPIYKIITAVVCHTTINIMTSAGLKHYTGSVDISDYIFESKEFNLLDSDQTKAEGKYCALCYQSGDNKITNFQSYNKYWILSGSNAIENILTKVISDNPSLYITDGVSTVSEDSTTIKVQSVYLNSIKDLSLMISYIPIETFGAIAYNNFGRELEVNHLTYNPSANIININYYGENIQATVNKLGNEELTMLFKTKTTDIPNVGEKVGEYYINKIYYEYYKHYSKIKLDLVKNFTKICEDIGIDSQMRLYTVPDDNYVVERILNIGDINFFGKNVSNAFKTAITNAYSANDMSYLENYGIEINIGEIGYTVLCPCSFYKVGNSILLSFGFTDNYIAGYCNNDGISKPINYTNINSSLGETERLNISIVNCSSRGVLVNDFPKYTGTNTENEMELEIYNVKKDVREKIKVSIQFYMEY